MPLNRRDTNEREIISALVAAGALVIQMDRRVGFDLLVAHSGQLYAVEVKQLSGKLTPAEKEMMRLMSLCGVEYHIVRSIDDALKVIGMG